MTDNSMREIATLGGGCFWCLEVLFDGFRGVLSVKLDYMGGKIVKPSYQQVCNGNAGHVEVLVQTFYIAEDYHQEYFANNGRQPYCQIVVTAKAAKFRKKLADRVKR